jgi:hypothetical protein
MERARVAGEQRWSGVSKLTADACAISAALLLLFAAASARAQTVPPASPHNSKTEAATPHKSDAEVLVPPQGGTAEVAVHVGEVCILAFPAPIAGRTALASSDDFEIKRWGEKEVAIRPLRSTPKQTTLAIATTGDELKVNVTLSVVGADKPARTYVSFRAVSAEEALTAQVEAAVAARTGPLEQEVRLLREKLDDLAETRAESIIATGIMLRNDTFPLSVHERNDDHVVLHVTRATIVGANGYLTIEIENRSSSPFRLYGVHVQAGTRDVPGTAEFKDLRDDAEVDIMGGGLEVKGVVAPGASAQGEVVVRSVDKLLGQQLSLTMTGPPGSQPIRIDRGIVFR